ncbi:uncharacterized protein [Nicotiana sylvestris]|uniref:uncharacterized protein n=1 Tax=Nicotiana sylvestris TaxID=4096 RepID=UPI00388CC8F9
MESMYSNQVWDLVEPSTGLKPIGCRWIYKNKREVDGKVQTFKARLVAKGFTQKEGIDYEETFSPVAMLKSIRILLSIVAHYNYEIWKMDVKTTFLNGSLDECIYMNDLLMFAKGEIISMQLLQEKFKIFRKASGLIANQSKSAIYYRGVAEITTRISSWTAKKLSYAGRVQLVKSVLFGIQSYCAQLFIIPAKVMKAIEGYCRSYIWSGTNEITKKSLVAWSKICLPKTAGGLNLTNLRLWNKVAIIRTCWDLKNKKEILWIKWIHEYYIKSQTLESMTIPLQASWMVKKILKARENLGYVQPEDMKNKSMIRNIYLKMVGELPKVTWKNIMCNNEARPKARFITWLQQQNRLLTATRLEKWGIQVDSRCVMCKTVAETRDHLFVKCPIRRYIWQKIMQWIQITWRNLNTWNQMQHWIEQNTKGKSAKSRIVKMIYTEYVYAIWMERNKRIFEQKETIEDTVAREIAYICHVRASSTTKRMLQHCKFPR